MAFSELPFDRDEIPVDKIFEIAGTEFTYRILHNSINDFYTMQIKDDLGVIVHTTKLVLLNDSLHPGSAILGITSEIIPVNREDNSDNELNFNNFNIGIFLVERTA